MQAGGTMVQDWTQMYGREIPTAGREGQRRYISNAERIRLQKKRRKLARRRRRRKIFCLGLVFIFLITMLITGVIALGKSLFGGLLSSADNETMDVTAKTNHSKKETDYGIRTPKKYEGEAIYTELENLADTYPEFKKVYENADTYPEELLAVLCSNPEMIDYVKGYPEADGSVGSGLTKKELAGGVPLLIQWDKRWGYVSYGDDNIGLSGCAPVCLSMVIVGLTGDSTATPDRIADYAMKNDHYVMGTGTAWSLMTAGGEPYGVFAQQMGLDWDVIFSTLEAGTPIICSMGAGDFTTSGHFIVLTGIEDGKIKVNDPNSRARSNKLWDFETLAPQILNMWAYYRY